jgi:hypothetical protein
MRLSTSNFERNESYLRVLTMDSLRTTNCGVSHDVMCCSPRAEVRSSSDTDR